MTKEALKLLKGLGATLGLGGTAMYLGNEGEGETFTSYPREARYKQLARGEEIPLPGLEDYVYGEGKHAPKKDRFGFGTPYPEKNKDSVGLFQGKNERDHIELFGRFIQPTLKEAGIDSNSQLDIMGKFMQAPFEMKVSMLKELSNDTDDALWQSEAFLRIQERSSK